jgi:hypothetical protein
MKPEDIDDINASSCKRPVHTYTSRTYAIEILTSEGKRIYEYLETSKYPTIQSMKDELQMVKLSISMRAKLICILHTSIEYEVE